MKKLLIILGVLCLLIPTSATLVPQTSDLQVTQTSYEPFPAEPGNHVKIYVNVQNKGTETKEDIWFRLNTEPPFSVEDPLKYRGKIYSSQKATLEYWVWVEADAEEDEYTDHLKLKKCRDKNCTIGTVTPINITVSKSHPILEVSSIELKEDISPGEKTQAKLTLKNRGSSRLKDVSLKLDLSSSSLPLVPYGGSTEKIISSIPAHGSGEVVFDLLASGDAESDTYKVPLNLTYYDESNNKYSKEDILGVTVGGKPSLKVGLEEYDYLSENSIGEVDFNIVNNGAERAKFVNVELLPTENYELLSPSEIYIGNMQSDDYETADFKIKLKETEGDSIDIPLQLTYSGVNNYKYIKDAQVELKVYSESEIKEIKGSPGYMKWIAGLFVLGLIIVLYKYRKKILSFRKK